MITSHEAGKTLEDIKAVSRRSGLAYGYREASPHLLLWGVIWALGYGLPAAGLAGYGIWPWLVVSGIIGSFWFSRPRKQAKPLRFDWRYGGSVAAGLIFIAGLFSVFMPVSGQQIGTVIPLIVGVAYLQLGIWTRGMRIALIGLVVTAAALYAYHGAREIFDLLMAITGGGGLILGGLWLRRL